MDLSLPGLEEGRLRRAPYVVSFRGGENVLYLQGRWLLNTVNVLNVANVTKKKKVMRLLINTTLTTLKGMILRERSQTPRATYCAIPFN